MHLCLHQPQSRWRGHDIENIYFLLVPEHPRLGALQVPPHGNHYGHPPRNTLDSAGRYHHAVT